MAILFGNKLHWFESQRQHIFRRSRWPHGLRPGSTAARLLGLWLRIPLGAWMSVCVECCVLCVVCCQVEVSATGCVHSSREILPTVMCLCVWSRNIKNGETMARVGPQRHRGDPENSNWRRSCDGEPQEVVAYFTICVATNRWSLKMHWKKKCWILNLCIVNLLAPELFFLNFSTLCI